MTHVIFANRKMSTPFLNKIRNFTEKSRIASVRGKIVYVEPDVKSVNCPNHEIEFRGITRPTKRLLVFNQLNELECECGTIYKKR